MKGHHSGTRVSHGAGGRHAYLSATLHKSENGLVTDYRGKAVIDSSGHLPDGVTKRPIDAVFREVDAYPVKKSRKNGVAFNPVVALDTIGAIPHELTQAQQIAAARDFGQRVSNRFCVPVAVGVHPPDNDQRNVHCHVLMACRTVDKDGRLSVYSRELNALAARPDAKIGKERTELPVIKLRRLWQDTMNEHLARANRPERIDMRSYKEQGIDLVPTRHLGKKRWEQQQAKNRKMKKDTVPPHVAAERLTLAGTVLRARQQQHKARLNEIRENRRGVEPGGNLVAGVGSVQAYERDAVGQFIRDMDRQNKLDISAHSRRMAAAKALRMPTEEEKAEMKALGRAIRRIDADLAQIDTLSHSILTTHNKRDISLTRNGANDHRTLLRDINEELQRQRARSRSARTVSM